MRSDGKSRVTNRVCGGFCLVVFAVLPARVGLAAEPMWCHQVRPGDTLAAIARRHRVSAEELRRLNRIGPKAMPRVRAILMLPAGVDRSRRRLDLSRPALSATPGRLRRESAAAATERLSRMSGDGMVKRFSSAGLLVAIPGDTRTFYVVGVRARLRVARPWTRQFIEHLAAAFHGFFGRRLRITSLTRTVLTQRALRRTNPSAAPTQGPEQSTHLTGAAVDLSKRSLTEAEVAWLRTVLDRLRRRGVIHAVEEFRQPHFHVMVKSRYREYGRRLSSPTLAGGC